MDDSDVITFKSPDKLCVQNVSNSEPDHDENESLCQNEIGNYEPTVGYRSCSPVRAGDGIDVHNNFEKFAHAIQRTVQSIKSDLRQNMTEFSEKLQTMQEQINHVKSCNDQTVQREPVPNLTHPIVVGMGQSTNNQALTANGVSEPSINCRVSPGDSNLSSTPVVFRSLETTENTSRRQFNQEICGRNKLKPQTYDGTDDLDEYLTQFNIVSELNGWNYASKSLFLASSIVGSARAILCELDSEKRRDFDAIVTALQNRYGSVHRAEIFRSQLQARHLERNETIPELAQSVKKLTRKAYPSASSEVVELLALDFFIDALPDADIRLRLREVGPKSISEAERIAVRLDAHKVADRSRGKHSVRQFTSEKTNTEKRLDELTDQLKQLMDQMKTYTQTNKFHNQKADGHNKTNDNDRKQGKSGWKQNKNNQTSRDNSSGSGNKQNQGNEERSSSWTSTRPAKNGPNPSN